MGQQQLLLIVLGVIIIGIAIAGGILYFRDNAIIAKRDKLIDESVNLASMAQAYYQKPVMFGGGGKSFQGWTIPVKLVNTTNGVYSIEQISDDPDFILIRAKGSEWLTAEDQVEVTIQVNPQSYQVTVVH